MSKNIFGLPELLDNGTISTSGKEIGPGHYTLDVKSGDFDFVLEAPTGSKSRYSFSIINAIDPTDTTPPVVKGNGVTFKVPVGNKLNSTTDKVIKVSTNTTIYAIDAGDTWTFSTEPSESKGLTKQRILDGANPLNGEGIYTVKVSDVTLPAATGSQDRYILINSNDSTTANGSGQSNGSHDLALSEGTVSVTGTKGVRQTFTSATTTMLSKLDLATRHNNGPGAPAEYVVNVYQGSDITGFMVGKSNIVSIPAASTDSHIESFVFNTPIRLRENTTYTLQIVSNNNLNGKLEVHYVTTATGSFSNDRLYYNDANTGAVNRRMLGELTLEDVTLGNVGAIIDNSVAVMNVTDGTNTWKSVKNGEVVYLIDSAPGKYVSVIPTHELDDGDNWVNDRNYKAGDIFNFSAPDNSFTPYGSEDPIPKDTIMFGVYVDTTGAPIDYTSKPLNTIEAAKIKLVSASNREKISVLHISKAYTGNTFPTDVQPDTYILGLDSGLILYRTKGNTWDMWANNRKLADNCLLLCDSPLTQYIYHKDNNTFIEYVHTNTPVVIYTTDGPLEDRDHIAVLTTGTTAMTLHSTTEKRNIEFTKYHNDPLTIVTTEEVTGFAGTTTDATVNVNLGFVTGKLTFNGVGKGWLLAGTA